MWNVGTRNAPVFAHLVTPEEAWKMEYLQMIIALGTLLSLIIIGCQTPIQPVVTHKLVAVGNQHSVPVYPDEQSYLHTSHEKQSGGVEGVVGDVKENIEAKQIDDQTPVQIVTSDENGAVITVTDGPMKGATGFVAKQNVD
jgi:hypothetical protein